MERIRVSPKRGVQTGFRGHPRAERDQQVLRLGGRHGGLLHPSNVKLRHLCYPLRDVAGEQPESLGGGLIDLPLKVAVSFADKQQVLVGLRWFFHSFHDRRPGPTRSGHRAHESVPLGGRLIDFFLYRGELHNLQQSVMWASIHLRFLRRQCR